jgi:hypothetical protein
MRSSVLAVLILAVLALAACTNGKGRFVKPVASPVAGEVRDPGASKYEDAYLRIFVSSNLDANGRLIDFGGERDRPAMMLISARFGKGTVASFAADADPEIPVLLYDVQAGKTLSSVVDNALLSEGLLVDPESLSKSPHLQIYVRGVAPDKAKWVTNLLQVATSEPLLKVGMSFVPGATAFSPLSTKLGDLLSDEIKTSNKPWEEKTLLGLRSDEGLFALDGRMFVVMLNSTKMELEAPPKLRRCENKESPSGLCTSDNQPWKPAQAYVRFELDVTDYRSIKDFIGAAVSCEADERTWSDYRALLASGQLAKRQTQYERHLLARGDLLMQIRRSQAETSVSRYAGRLLQHAQQYTLLQTPDDGFWQEHLRDRARQLDACIRSTAVRGQAQYAAIWDSATELFTQSTAYPNWALANSADADAPVLREAERELRKLQQLMSVNELRSLDAQSLEPLSSLGSQLQQLLLPGYTRVAEAIVASTDPAEAKLQKLGEMSARSACRSCREYLDQQSAGLRAQQPPATPAVSEPPGNAASPNAS